MENYNDSGRTEGPQSEWWENGNKKSETLDKHGRTVSGTEYYRDGRPRVTYVTLYHPDRGVSTTKYISAASWAPDGRPTGKVVDGNGTFMLWPDTPKGPLLVFQEVYKDSVLQEVNNLDSAQVEDWLRKHPAKP